MAGDLPPHGAPEAFGVAFVCTGNRARSPLAQAFFAARVPRSRSSAVSRGTLDGSGLPALPKAVAAGAIRGVDLSGHRSATMARGEFANAGLVVGFEPFHVAAAVIDGQASRRSAFTILELAEILVRLERDGRVLGRRDPLAVVEMAHEARRGPMLAAPTFADPIGAPQRVFDQAAEAIEGAVATIATMLFSPLDEPSMG